MIWGFVLDDLTWIDPVILCEINRGIQKTEQNYTVTKRNSTVFCHKRCSLEWQNTVEFWRYLTVFCHERRSLEGQNTVFYLYTLPPVSAKITPRKWPRNRHSRRFWLVDCNHVITRWPIRSQHSFSRFFCKIFTELGCRVCHIELELFPLQKHKLVWDKETIVRCSEWNLK